MIDFEALRIDFFIFLGMVVVCIFVRILFDFLEYVRVYRYELQEEDALTDKDTQAKEVRHD